MNNEKVATIVLMVLLVVLAVLSLVLSIVFPIMLIVAVGSVLIIYFYCIKKIKAINKDIEQAKKAEEEAYKNSYAGRQEALSKMTREEKIENNDFVPFDTDMTEIARLYPYEELRYNYTDVKCNIIGDINGLREGSVLLVQSDGKLKNSAGEIVAQIENKKLSDMVKDYFRKEDRFSTVSCRFTKAEEDCIFCNLGFFVYNEEEEEDEADEEDEN